MLITYSDDNYKFVLQTYIKNIQTAWLPQNKQTNKTEKKSPNKDLISKFHFFIFFYYFFNKESFSKVRNVQ